MRAFPVSLPSGARYWTVLDEDLAVVAEADAFLRHVRFGRDGSELTTRSYAGGVALFLRWCARTGRHWHVGVEQLGLFITWLRHAGSAASGTDVVSGGQVLAGPGADPVRGARRINGVLTAVRGFVTHAVQAPTRLMPLIYGLADDRDLPAQARGEDEGRMAWRMRARHCLHEPEPMVDRARDEEIVVLLRACQLRHAFGSNLADAGSGLDEIAELLGHAAMSSSQVYLHPDPTRLRDAVERGAQSPRAGWAGPVSAASVAGAAATFAPSAHMFAQPLADRHVTAIGALVDPAFLAEAGWDPATRRHPEPAHVRPAPRHVRGMNPEVLLFTAENTPPGYIPQACRRPPSVSSHGAARMASTAMRTRRAKRSPFPSAQNVVVGRGAHRLARRDRWRPVERSTCMPREAPPDRAGTAEPHTPHKTTAPRSRRTRLRPPTRGFEPHRCPSHVSRVAIDPSERRTPPAARPRCASQTTCCDQSRASRSQNRQQDRPHRWITRRNRRP